MSTILVFDSGIGGLSVVHHIQQQLPGATIHYVADHAAYPYGNKEEAWLIKRVDQYVSKMTRELQPDLIVIACNTASTLALPQLRSHIQAPIIGVVPAIKTAAKISRSKRIGLLATPGTIARAYIDELIQAFALDCEIDRLGTTVLVHLAEDKLLGIPVDLQQLRSATQALIHQNTDTVVLGCTHFPLLLPELQSLYPEINFVDSGEAIARRALSLLENASPSTSHTHATFYSSGVISHELKQQLVQYQFKTHTQINFNISATA